MIQRLIVSSGIAALAACVLTPVGYLLAGRHHGRFQDAFQGHWEIIAAGLALVVLGLLEVGRGLVLCFGVLGAFEVDNLVRGAGSVLVGAGITALGVALLWNLLLGPV
ncbi:hypothetical protein GCM10010193_44300 [Kitasatospora atroaurantiaca]|uniref:Uncharacterized protein n=1 Tax=Kitasatospora atroaurantiaca TaxID=285545 RepID=A0A561EI30_9ACTN|nr:hypothetical protein [Kitasatospora atroaurantiaca]TWE15270.1 hypothetical protein FB465_0153 [Kitasatospora atroaurantiaca]